MIVDKLIDFISLCPHLNELTPVKADYLDEDAINYCIETSPASTLIQTLIDGSSERQLAFIFSSKEIMSDFDDVNLENITVYENFSEWIEEQNRAGNLPQLEGNLDALSVEVTSPGYVAQSEADRGIYCIQMRLKYYKGK